jgi:hypothetical protein
MSTVTIEITQEEELDWLRYSNESLRKQRPQLMSDLAAKLREILKGYK